MRMSLHDNAGHRDERSRNFFASPLGLGLLGFMIIVGALMLTEHRAHLWGLLIWLPLLACPLMHFFMHGGHGHHSGRVDRPRSTP
jgi:hypothetical protein